MSAPFMQTVALDGNNLQGCRMRYFCCCWVLHAESSLRKQQRVSYQGRLVTITFVPLFFRLNIGLYGPTHPSSESDRTPTARQHSCSGGALEHLAMMAMQQCAKHCLIIL